MAREYSEAAQSSQTVLPSSENLPEGQALQLALALLGVYEPLGQPLQSLDPGRE